MSGRMNKAALNAFMAREFPQMSAAYRIEDVMPAGIRMTLHAGVHHLRPGGTVSGPALFALADVVVYLAILAMIGPEALAVTTSCSMDFMRKPGPGVVTAEARILKLGRVLAVGDVLIWSKRREAPVARATLTYSIPPKRHSGEEKDMG